MRKRIINSGDKFNRLTIIEEVKGDKTTVLAKCDCGVIKQYRFANILNHHTKSCGCLLVNKLINRRENVIGKEYGNLTVLKEVELAKNKHRMVIAQCGCDGNIKKYDLNKLRTGHTKSCGCFKKGPLYKKIDYEKVHPLFCKIEEIMDNPNPDGCRILVKCKKCGNWFPPITTSIV